MKLPKPIAAILPLVASAMLAAAVIATPSPAQAAVVPHCVVDGPGAEDVALSQRLNPVMTGWLNAGGFTPARAACARVIVEAVRARNLPVRAATIAITTAIVESRLHNLDYGDRDSLGLYQQRPSMGWGTREQILNPVFATNAFLNAMQRLYPNNSWQTAAIGKVCQDVQRSAYEHRYQPEAADADRIARAVWADPQEPPALVGGSKDFTGDGIADVLGRHPNGDLYLYPASPTGLTYASKVKVHSGWNVNDWLYAANLDYSAGADLVGRNDDGDLLLYSNTGKAGTGLFDPTPTKIGSGWNIMSWIGVADVNGDRLADMVGRRKDGNVYVYPNTGKAGTGTFGAPYDAGSGWNIMDAMLVADYTGDGRADLVGRDGSGKLWLYPASVKDATDTRPTYSWRAQIGSGWHTLNGLSVAHTDKDTLPDIVARDRAGKLWRYTNSGKGLMATYADPPAYVGSGWNAITAIA